MNLERMLVLVGPMGAGKSSVGRLLATRWNLPFLDADAEIEHRAGLSITRLFERDGEAAFRMLEREVLADLLARPAGVLATGGGAVLDADNRERMHARGCVVHLHVSVEAQVRRLEGDHSRPLLARPDRAAVLQAMAAQRTPLYRELAELSVDTDALEADAVASVIETRLAVRENTLEARA
ncbi:shikimate kinase [Lysobacter korlensis]|uniref:Shikimate kinase n=1 Tax=Lysobacter korlensis TaxID=553636 RepID=A0ABV6S0F8_9GAMM